MLLNDDDLRTFAFCCILTVVRRDRVADNNSFIFFSLDLGQSVPQSVKEEFLLSGVFDIEIVDSNDGEILQFG